jgi:phytoene/squalene synthetase
MKTDALCSERLAAEITRLSSAQTYFTIRLLADRDRAADALRAYAYFRWVDDAIDGDATPEERSTFLTNQQALLEACYRGDDPGEVCPEEQVLVDLVAHDREPGSGLQSYLRNMMAVMVFDAARRGRLISQMELATYSRVLSNAVTDALHYFIGHRCAVTRDESRYLPVRGAHIIHMLRDWAEDHEAGYINLPREYINSHSLTPRDESSAAYRKWVEGRVRLAQADFQAGREYLAGARSLRLKLACSAYIARFEWMARTIEKDGYQLRAAYPQRRSLQAGAWMLWRTLATVLGRKRSVASTPRPPRLAISEE